MDGLVALPHKDGIQLLNDKLFKDITKFSLVDDNGDIYFTQDIHSVYFDTNGILTASIIIPKEDNFTSWNSAILLKTDSDVTICTVPTEPIKFVTGIGGEQEVKITISGEVSTIVFKKDEYITMSEANNILLMPIIAMSEANNSLLTPLIANTSHTLFLQDKLIEQGVMNVG
jgi:hypothetical protein